MENIRDTQFENYEKIIHKVLEIVKDDIDDKIIIEDKQNHHYQLVYVGQNSSNQTYSFQLLIHFQLRSDGVICIFENRTEVELADILIEMGVPKSNILIGFLPQSIRQYAGYAAA
jgi:hypothetical protein